MSLEILLNIHTYPSFVLSRYFLKLSIYLVLKLTLVISLYGILVSASHFPSASNSLIVSLFFPAFIIIPIFTTLSERIEYALPRAYINFGRLDLLCNPIQSVYLFTDIILDFRFFQFVKVADRISVKLKVVFFLSSICD